MKRFVVAVGLFLFITLGFSQQFIADYSVAKEEVLRSIPQQYIDYARDNYKIVYWHTSHGTHVYRGLCGLPDYKTGDDILYAITNNNTTSGKLDFHDIYGKDLSVQETTFDDITRTYLDDPVNANINVVMWSWCDITGHDPANNYLPLMQDLIDEYGEGGSKIGSGDGQRVVPVKFIFMTGHAVANANTGDGKPKDQAAIITDYCNTNNYLCLDYYSIDSHDMNDKQWDDVSDDAVSALYLADGGTTNNFYKDFQNLNSIGNGYYENKNAPGGFVIFGAHNSQHITSNRKAYAMWWILARMAGWDGVPTKVSAEPSEPVEIGFNQKLKQLTVKEDIPAGSVCRVYNLTGSLCLEQKVNSSSISLANLHRGLYIVSLSTSKVYTTKKIMIR